MKTLLCFFFLYLTSVALADRRDKRDCVPEAVSTPCSRCTYTTQADRDACYMRVALAFGVSQNSARPYGAIIVNHATNVISCYGVSNGNANTLDHGEMAAFRNCTALYPSPTGNDVANPGLDWVNHTLYTTAEPCPMCAAACMWRGLGRVVYGTDIPTLIRLGSKQIILRTEDVFNKGQLSMFKTGGNGSPPSTSVPYLHGGILSNETDIAFFSGFGFPYPPVVNSQYYGTPEDVFLRHNGDCGCGANN